MAEHPSLGVEVVVTSHGSIFILQGENDESESSTFFFSERVAFTS